MTSTLGVIFEDFYMCVSLTYKDKLQDNYSIFNEFLMNYTQIVSFKLQENGQRLSSERVKMERQFTFVMVYCVVQLSMISIILNILVIPYVNLMALFLFLMSIFLVLKYTKHNIYQMYYIYLTLHVQYLYC